MNGNNGTLRPTGPSGPPGASGPGGRRPQGGRFGGRRRLALIGVAGESVGVLAGAVLWRYSGEPAWIVMAVVSLALALIMVRHV
ncbi:MAG: hypothetical protein ACR2NO_07110 [Chloroflexota bacterium]